MLVKLNSLSFAEDYGLLVNHRERPYIHMFENGIVPLTAKMKPVPVVKVNALWVERDAKVRCDVADTDERKRVGLQAYPSLKESQGLYFPYPGYADVMFHQGTVPYSLDVMFLRDGTIVGLERETRVGSGDRWGCQNCDGVIEVNGGFCEENDILKGDRLTLFAFSQDDIDAYEDEQVMLELERTLVHVMAGMEDG